MIFLLIPYIIAKIENTCTINNQGTVLLEYYKNENQDYNLMEPNINLLEKYSEQNGMNLKFQKINCNLCACPEIKSLPTFKLYKDNKEMDSFTGFTEYNDLLKFINKNLKIKHEKVEIIDLKEQDFYSTFEGPWLIHFYNQKSPEIDSLLLKLSEQFGNKIKLGRINEQESKNIVGRYNINIFPVILGVYNDLSSPFLEDLQMENLVKFTNRLIEHPFSDMNYNELIEKMNNSSQFYVVLYNNIKTANLLFFKYAHSFKFKLEMYKSNDKKVIEKIGLPEKLSKEVNIALYKNGKFHIYDQDIFDNSLLIEWIFHTHFPNVIKVSDLTFHTVFNGFKPVFLLLTTEDRLLPEFEKFAAKVHGGMPFVKLIFASINLNEYMLFSQALLPKIEVPTLVVYNPFERLWYHKKIILKKSSLESQSEEILKLYESGKLKPYLQTDFKFFAYFFWVSFIVLLCAVIYTNERFYKR